MTIANILIEEVDFSFDYCYTLEEKEKLLDRIVAELNKKHFKKIAEARALPLFFIDGVASKINIKKEK